MCGGSSIREERCLIFPPLISRLQYGLLSWRTSIGQMGVCRCQCAFRCTTRVKHMIRVYRCFSRREDFQLLSTMLDYVKSNLDQITLKCPILLHVPPPRHGVRRVLTSTPSVTGSHSIAGTLPLDAYSLNHPWKQSGMMWFLCHMCEGRGKLQG